MNFIHSEIFKIVALVYLAVNVIVFLMYAIDKFKARHNLWRIPESTLLLGAVFGIFGAILGMHLMHHKTRKPKFRFGVPAILVLEVSAIVLYYLKFCAHMI